MTDEPTLTDCRHCYCWKPGRWCCWCERIVGEEPTSMGGFHHVVSERTDEPSLTDRLRKTPDVISGIYTYTNEAADRIDALVKAGDELAAAFAYSQNVGGIDTADLFTVRQIYRLRATIAALLAVPDRLPHTQDTGWVIDRIKARMAAVVEGER